MKHFKVILGISLLAILLIACGSNDENTPNNNENNNPVTNEENNVDDTNETEKDDENNSSNTGNTSANDDGKFGDNSDVLSLGETGEVESTVGDYEVTFESFELLDEIEGEESVKNDGIFVLMDATVEITGEEPIEADEIYTARLYTEDGPSSENTLYYESIDLFEGTIESGDTEEGQFLFSIAEGDSYELVLNDGLDGVATELTWEFDADEASN